MAEIPITRSRPASGLEVRSDSIPENTGGASGRRGGEATGALTGPARAGSVATNEATDPLTRALEEKLSHPASSPDFDLHQEVNRVLADVGMTIADCGGELSFYGRDPILPSRIRFGTMAGVALAARSVALAALWRQATGEGQDISVDVRKAFRRFCGFEEGKWETINGRAPSPGPFALRPISAAVLP